MKTVSASKEKSQTSLFKDDVAWINGEFNIVKENTLIRANYALGLYEHRVMAVIASLMKPSDTKDTRYFFRVRDFADYFGLKSKDIYSALQDVLIQLRQKTFVLQRPNDVKRVTGWINWAEIIPSTGIVEVSVDDRIRPYFLDVKETLGYTKYQLKYVKEFKCPYAYRLYEKFKEVLRGKNEEELYMSFEQIKEWLAIENQYNQFSDLRKRVLLPALEDINGYSDKTATLRKKVKKLAGGSDLKVTMTEKKPGKKILGVTFYIKQTSPKEKNLETFESSPAVYEILTEAQNAIITEFLSVGVNQIIIDQAIEKYGIENLSYLYKNYKKKKAASDPAAYAAATLLNGWGIPKNEQEHHKKHESDKQIAINEISASTTEAAALEQTEQLIDQYLNTLSPLEITKLKFECKAHLLSSCDDKAAFFKPDKADKPEYPLHRVVFRNYIKNHKLSIQDENPLS